MFVCNTMGSSKKLVKMCDNLWKEDILLSRGCQSKNFVVQCTHVVNLIMLIFQAQTHSHKNPFLPPAYEVWREGNVFTLCVCPQGPPVQSGGHPLQSRRPLSRVRDPCPEWGPPSPEWGTPHPECQGLGALQIKVHVKVRRPPRSRSRSRSGGPPPGQGPGQGLGDPPGQGPGQGLGPPPQVKVQKGGGTGGMPLAVTQEDCLVIYNFNLNTLSIEKKQCGVPVEDLKLQDALLDVHL